MDIRAWLYPKLHPSLVVVAEEMVCEKRRMPEFTVHNNIGEKYPNELLLPVRFWSVCIMDTEHENNNMTTVVHPHFIHTTHDHKVITYSAPI